jgi:hypothetical protein
MGDVWIFQNLEAEDVEALSHEAFLEKSTKGQALFLQGIRENLSCG